MLPLVLLLHDKNRCAGYATVCAMCLERLTKVVLRKCSGCKLIFYCSKVHQKLHWPIHKRLCKAVQSMITCKGKIGLFDDYINEGWFYLWVSYKRSLVTCCESIMQQKLLPEERALFLNPFACKVCHLHKPSCMITCSKCSVVAYCSEKHKSKDKLQHSLVCNELKNSLDYDTICQKNIFIIGSVNDVRVLPADMKDFIDRNVLITMEHPVHKLYAGWFLSNRLTIPLTLIYIIEKSKMFQRNIKLRIHVLGSSKFESDAQWCWEYIFHYFNKLRSIDIVFIGPGSLHQLIQPPKLMCQDCEASRLINVSVEPSLYHNYVTSNTVAPEIIVAFNCGFNDYMKNGTIHNTWKDSFGPICSFPGAVIAFTSYFENESRTVLQALQEFSKSKTILVECQKNPYRGLVPYYDYDNEVDQIYYCNNFITILTT